MPWRSSRDADGPLQMTTADSPAGALNPPPAGIARTSGSTVRFPFCLTRQLRLR
jgi:hypothetical protein